MSRPAPVLRLVLTLLVPVLMPTPILAHGVTTDITHGPAVMVTVTYGDGQPMVLETCEVLAPDDSTAFQVGRTDRLGRVVFAPDRSGTWRVKVTTADGHGAEVPVEVDVSLFAVTGESTRPRTQVSKIITGIGVLLGIFGVVALVQRRQG